MAEAFGHLVPVGVWEVSEAFPRASLYPGPASVHSLFPEVMSPLPVPAAAAICCLVLLP